VALDTIRGIYHFLGDTTPKNVALVEPKPRKINQWVQDNKAVVATVKASDDIRQSIERTIAFLGDRLDKVFHRGDKVLLKPNFNSPDPPPASTDIAFLKAVIEILLEIGARVTIGESSGGVWRPSRNVFRKKGVYELARDLRVELIAFEDMPVDRWVRIKINGDYLKEVTMPRYAYEADKLVYLPCLKTHRLAKYSGALKLAFGFVHPGERRSYHFDHRAEKLAEISLCWQPDLIIMDGRKAFVTGGPNTGEIVEPRLIMASGDLVAIDVEAVKILKSYPAKNTLPADPWRLGQITTALKHNLGAGPNGYVVLGDTQKTDRPGN
jgi:uncharacterized protein (DUF362 family)